MWQCWQVGPCHHQSRSVAEGGENSKKVETHCFGTELVERRGSCPNMGGWSLVREEKSETQKHLLTGLIGVWSWKTESSPLTPTFNTQLHKVWTHTVNATTIVIASSLFEIQLCLFPIGLFLLTCKSHNTSTLVKLIERKVWMLHCVLCTKFEANFEVVKMAQPVMELLALLLHPVASWKICKLWKPQFLHNFASSSVCARNYLSFPHFRLW